MPRGRKRSNAYRKNNKKGYRTSVSFSNSGEAKRETKVYNRSKKYTGSYYKRRKDRPWMVDVYEYSENFIQKYWYFLVIGLVIAILSFGG